MCDRSLYFEAGYNFKIERRGHVPLNVILNLGFSMNKNNVFKLCKMAFPTSHFRCPTMHTRVYNLYTFQRGDKERVLLLVGHR